MIYCAKSVSIRKRFLLVPSEREKMSKTIEIGPKRCVCSIFRTKGKKYRFRYCVPSQAVLGFLFFLLYSMSQLLGHRYPVSSGR